MEFRQVTIPLKPFCIPSLEIRCQYFMLEANCELKNVNGLDFLLCSSHYDWCLMGDNFLINVSYYSRNLSSVWLRE
jgi:hypothetical protein